MSLTPTAMTIAGSDSSCGAGIQADLRMFSARGVYGATVITALTAQNPSAVTGVLGVETAFVEQQLDAIMSAVPVAAIKTGMLWSADTIKLVTRFLERFPLVPCVVDPVMISTSGAKLVSDEAIDLYRTHLLPRCMITTPNLDEARVLLDCGPITSEQLDNVAIRIHELFGCAVLLKGGHLDGHPVDVLFDGNALRRWEHQRLLRVNTHGSGCMLSAAIAAELAKQARLDDAVDAALGATLAALAAPQTIADGFPMAGIEAARLTTAR